MAVANVTLTDTFDQWRIKTNQLISVYDQTNELALRAYNVSNSVANSAANIAVELVYGNTTIMNTIYRNANTITYDWIGNNDITTIKNRSNIAVNTANYVYQLANGISNTSNYVYQVSNSVYNVSNIVYASSNNVANVSNLVYDFGNTVFGASNTVSNSINTVYNTVNNYTNTVNSIYVFSNNTVNTFNSLMVTVNTYSNTVNTIFARENNVTNTVNSIYVTTNNYTNTVNNIYVTSNNLNNTVNSIYVTSNTLNNTVNNIFVTSNNTVNVTNSILATVNTISNTVNTIYVVSNNTVNVTNSILATVNNFTNTVNAVYVSQNNVTNTVNSIYVTTNNYTNTVNGIFNTSNNTSNSVTAAYITVNTYSNTVNSFFATINNTSNVSNAVFVASNGVSNVSNLVYSFGNTVFGASNGVSNSVNTVFIRANDYTNTVNSIYVTSNNLGNTVNNIYVTSNNLGNTVNNIYVTSNNLGNTVNNIYVTSNNVSNTANYTFVVSNNSANVANVVYARSNDQSNLVNSMFATVNNSANSVTASYITTNNSANIVNTFYVTTNNVSNVSNLVYSFGNTVFGASNGVSNSVNTVFVRANDYSNTVNTMFVTVNATANSVNAAYITTNNFANVVNTFFATSNNVSNTVNTIYVVSNNTVNVTNSILATVNNNTNTVNTMYVTVNGSANLVNASYVTTNNFANVVNTFYVATNNSSNISNIVFGFGNTVFGASNGVSNSVNTVFIRANDYSNLVNSIYVTTNNVSNVVNAVYVTINNASNTVNGVYVTTNNTSNVTNSIYVTTNNTSNVSNLVYVVSNNTGNSINSIFLTTNNYTNSVNNIYVTSNNLGNTVNNIYVVSNNTVNTVNGIFVTSNNLGNTVNSIYLVANTSSNVANIAYLYANNAYNIANNVQLNVSNIVANTLAANTQIVEMINATANLVVYSYLSTTDFSAAYVRANLSYQAANQSYNIANIAFDQSNTAYNVAINAASMMYVNGAANSVNTTQWVYANGVANSANAYAVTVGTASNIALRIYSNGSANSANAYAVTVGAAGNTYLMSYANTIGNNSNSVAATKVASVTGTAGQIFSSGGTTPSLNLITTAVTAASYGGGTNVAVYTVDTFGRLTYAANVTFVPMDYIHANNVGVYANGYSANVGVSANSYAAAVGVSANVYASNAANSSNIYSMVYANSAANAANSNAATKVASVTGTAGQIFSSGGTTPTLNLISTGVTAASYGSNSNVSVVTVDAFGRVTGAANIALNYDVANAWSNTKTANVLGSSRVSAVYSTTGGYNNVTIDLATSGVSAASYGSNINISVITVDSYGRLTYGANVRVNYDIANNWSNTKTANVLGSSGRVTAAYTTTGGYNNVTVDLATSGVSSGTYGDNTNVSVMTVDTYGRVTSASNVRVNYDIANNWSNTKTANVLGTSGRVTAAYTTTGGYNNVTVDLATSGVSSGTYGDNTNVSVITVDSYGRVTTASNVRINYNIANTWANTKTANVLGSGAVSAVYTTTSGYNNVTVDLTATGVTPTTYGGNDNISVFTVDTQGRLTFAGNVRYLPIAYAYANTIGNNSNSVAATKVASVTGTAGQIFSSGGTTPTLNLITTAVTASTYGSANNIPVFTVDTFGRLTYAANVAVQGMDYPFANGVANSANLYGMAYANGIGNSVNSSVSSLYYLKTGGTITGDVAITGNLTISGLTTYANTQSLNVGDNLIVLNADLPSSVAPIENSGIEVNRGNKRANAQLLWIESANAWGFTDNSSNIITTYVASNTLVEVGVVTASAWTNTKTANVIGTARVTAVYSTTGGYNNVTVDLSTTGVTATNYGGATQIPVFTVDSYGRLTYAANVAVQGMDYPFANGVANAANSVAATKVASVTGTAGQIFSSGGTTPTLNLITTAVTSSTYGGATQIPVFTVDTFGRLTYAANVVVQGMDYPFANGAANSANLYGMAYANGVANSANIYGMTYANSSFGTIANTASAFRHANTAFDKANGAAQLSFVNVAANGSNLVADSNTDTLILTPTAPISIVGDSGTDTVTIGLQTSGVTATTYGSANQIPIYTVDTFGRITYAANVNISVPSTTLIGNTAPTGQTSGTLWWNTDLARLFVYYTDVDSSQWVEANPVITGSINDVANSAYAFANGVGNSAYAFANGVGNSAYAFANGVANSANIYGMTFANTKLANSTVTLAGTLTTTGAIIDSKGDVRNNPPNDRTASMPYSLTISDAGKTIIGANVSATQNTIFIPNTVFSPGNTIYVYNNSASVLTLTQNSGVTLRLAGSATTGNRNIAQRGFVTIYCVFANNFVVSGDGVT